MANEGVGPVDSPDGVPGDTVPPAAAPAGRSDQLLAEFYDQLRVLAQSQLNGERPGHTLQATALVHEAYMKLTRGSPVQWTSPAHFFAAAAEAMRRVLIDHARARGRDKRGGGRRVISLPEGEVLDFHTPQNIEALADLEDSICRLEREEPRLGQVVRYRFYLGLSIQQVAEVLGISETSVKVDWQYARARLFRDLTGLAGNE